ncbi:MAG: transcriptional regulator [Methanoculleus sp. SDB]|nr:MAG: transcriptional regulator [Methanoculleus sp. SDB]
MSVARFWRKQPQRYNLIGTRCETCGTAFFPPRSFCPECRRDGRIVEHTFAGTGKVVTFTVIRTASEAFELLTPYVLAIVELDEGARLTSQIVCSPDEVFIGMPVRNVFRKLGSDGESGPLYYGTKFIPAL